MAMTHSEQNHEPQHRLGLSADEVLTTTRALRKRLDLQLLVPRDVVEETACGLLSRLPVAATGSVGTSFSSRTRTPGLPWHSCGDSG